MHNGVVPASDDPSPEPHGTPDLSGDARASSSGSSVPSSDPQHPPSRSGGPHEPVGAGPLVRPGLEPSGGPAAGLASRFAAGDTLTALFAKMPCAAQVEIAGQVGFDLVVLDTEHGPGGGFALEQHLQAADAAGLAALVRVGDTR